MSILQNSIHPGKAASIRMEMVFFEGSFLKGKGFDEVTNDELETAFVSVNNGLRKCLERRTGTNYSWKPYRIWIDNRRYIKQSEISL